MTDHQGQKLPLRNQSTTRVRKEKKKKKDPFHVSKPIAIYFTS